MIKKVVMKHKVGKAVKIECTFKGKLEDYAMAWLHLTNNAREYPFAFLKHYNNAGNNVTVITTEQYQEKMKEYLEGLAHDDFDVEVWDTTVIQTIIPLVDWECDFKDSADDDVEVLPEQELD